jgi:hypothetical protein
VRDYAGVKMRNEESVINVLDDAIESLAKKAASENEAGSYALALASAVRELAEARAWMISPNQPHGGSVTHKS